jgi:hypothetical protein
MHDTRAARIKLDQAMKLSPVGLNAPRDHHLTGMKLVGDRKRSRF